MPVAVALREPPEPRGDLFFHHLLSFRNRPLEFLDACVRDHGDVVRVRFPGGRIAHVVAFPEGVKHVLQDNAKNYDKETHGFAKLRSLLGRGLLTSEGDFWLKQRRLMQPAFHRQRLASFAALMVRDTEELIARWDEYAARGKPIDVANEMMKLTLRIVSESLLSRNLAGDADTIGEALTFAMHHVNSRITKIFDPPEDFPTPDNRRYLKARATLFEVVDRVIAERRQSGKDPGDLLSMLLEARDEETGQPMDDQQLRYEVLTLFLAGHETTANALAWTFHALHQNPVIGARLTTETRRVLGGRSPTLEDLPKLDYARMVLDESMRLYPPAWLLVRRALQDDEIGGFHIPALTYVMVPPWSVHHNPRVWPQPELFDPERFSKERQASIPRYAYFPFGGGPRLCIGQSFALMEAQLILAMLAQRFRLKAASFRKVRFDPQITLRPRDGLPMVIERVR